MRIYDAPAGDPADHRISQLSRLDGPVGVAARSGGVEIRVVLSMSADDDLTVLCNRPDCWAELERRVTAMCNAFRYNPPWHLSPENRARARRVLDNLEEMTRKGKFLAETVTEAEWARVASDQFHSKEDLFQALARSFLNLKSGLYRGCDV